LASTGPHSGPRRARTSPLERPHPAKDFTGTWIVTRGTWHGRRVDMSWIERDDLVRLIAHAISDGHIEGPFNATAPGPVRNAEFTRALARALKRPALLPVPAAPLRWIAGDLARELLLGGQKVLPEKAMASGFVFRHATLDRALQSLLGAKA
jgi:NAD dependent epimerase/dehydratase family enzyme